MGIEGIADSDSYNAEACAAMLDVLVESDISNLEHVSSLWPGLEPPEDHVPPEARSAEHPTAIYTSTVWWGGKHFLMEAEEMAHSCGTPTLSCISSRCTGL